MGRPRGRTEAQTRTREPAAWSPASRCGCSGRLPHLGVPGGTLCCLVAPPKQEVASGRSGAKEPLVSPLTRVLFQPQPLKQEEDRPRRPGLASLTELPRLKLSGVTSLSSSRLALPSVFGHRGSGMVPGLRPLKCGGANQKVAPASRAPLSAAAATLACTERRLFPSQTDPQKEVKPNLKQCRLPTIERRGGGC